MDTPPEDRLPRAYLLALRLAAIGADYPLIADCVGVEPEAVGPLLEVAKAKALDAGISVPVVSHPIDLRAQPTDTRSRAITPSSDGPT